MVLTKLDKMIFVVFVQIFKLFTNNTVLHRAMGAFSVWGSGPSSRYAFFNSLVNGNPEVESLLALLD